MNKVKCSILLTIMGSFLGSFASDKIDSIESLSGIFDFGMDSFHGKPGAESDARLVKTWDFAADRLYKYLFTAFRESDLPALAKRVDELGKEIFKVEIYKSKLKPYNQKFAEYKDEMYKADGLFNKLYALEKKKDLLKKDIDKKLGFKDKAKLFFSSKITKAIKNDEQEVRAFLSTIVDQLSGVLTKIKKIIESEQNPGDKETKRRQG